MSLSVLFGTPEEGSIGLSFVVLCEGTFIACITSDRE